MAGRQAAPGEAAEAGHLAGAGRRAAALEAVRASAATRARYSLSTARRTKAAVEERQLVAAIEASLASRASWRGTADSDGRYTREVTRLACMQAEAATWACTGAPASHVAISRYGAQHGARGSRVVAPAREAPSARGRLDVPLPIARRILETSVA